MKAKSRKKRDLGIKPIYQYALPGGENACGYCSMSAIYDYYGIDADELDVEECLGTQHSLPYNFPGREMIEGFFHKKGADTAGTWPFDVLAVLYWHGFDTKLVPKTDESLESKVKSQIDKGDPILVHGWNFIHWFVISGYEGDKLIITDSTCKENYKRPFDEFIAKKCNGLIFVSRKKNAGIRKMTNADFAKQYARGVKFCLQLAGGKLNDIIGNGKKGGTIVGNSINRLFGYKEGTIVGNWVNRMFR